MFHRESGVFKTSYVADMAVYPLPIAKWTVAGLAVAAGGGIDLIEVPENRIPVRGKRKPQGERILEVRL